MPFGPYKDFDDCVSKNRDKNNPQAYCGFIKHQVEDKKEAYDKAEMEAMKIDKTLKEPKPWRERMNTLATLLAGGSTISGAAKAMGVDATTAKRLFRRIKDELGWQAQ